MPIVLGTAGHIDHGKTSLVRALTGIDCDRLSEERRRGITIELGFAHCRLADGTQLGIVDVPGHERFVRNMVAGATGIDFVMLIIAADEGVMPQTREHLDICTLLGVRHGLVALTKIDMVDAELLQLAMEDVTAFLRGTFLEGAPVFPVSAVTGEGVDALRACIVREAEKLAPARGGDIFRLPVDRVFTMKGHGTVVTGTLIAGAARVGDEVRVMPPDTPSRIRSLQVHNAGVEAAVAGQRCAVNLQGLEVEDINRGQVLAHPGTLFPATRWMVRVRCLASAPRPLRHRSQIHFHHGTREVAARLYFYDREKLEPGQEAIAEARFGEPMVGVYADRFVVRAYAPLRTIAGGMVLHPEDCALRRRDAAFGEKLSLLERLPELAGDELVCAQLALAGGFGCSFARLAALSNLPARVLEKLLAQLSSAGRALCYDKEERLWISRERLTALTDACIARAADFHRREPLKPGMARGVLTEGLPPRLAHLVLERALKAGQLVSEGESLRLPGHTVALAGEQADVKAGILAAHEQGGLTPPNMKDVLENLGVDPKKAAPIIQVLVNEKALVRVRDGLYYSAAALEEVKERVRQWFASHDDLDLAGMKELLGGVSRKFLIALLEYLDASRTTVRVGDKRQWRGRDK